MTRPIVIIKPAGVVIDARMITVSPMIAMLAGGPGDLWARWALLVIAADRAVPATATFMSDPVAYTVTLNAADVAAFRRHLLAFGFEVH